MHSFLLLAACLSCAPPGSNAPMPWLRGFTTTAIADVSSVSVSDRLEQWQDCGDRCTDYGGIEVIADVAGTAEPDTILASFSQGLFVLDRAGQVLARSPGFDAAGSADELLAISVGDAMIGTPVIALSARIGGRSESSVWLELYRVHGTKLDRLFAAVVEQHEHDNIATGSITLMPGGLVYQAPRGSAAELWLFDPRAGRYLYRGALVPARRPNEPFGRVGHRF